MKFFEFGKKNKPLNPAVPTDNASDTFIRPFKEMPSTNNEGQESANRINAHDLFSFYTADIIKEDTVFSR